VKRLEILSNLANLDMINLRDRHGNTPLHVVCGTYEDECNHKSASVAMVKFLLKQKDIECNKPDLQGDTPLHRACSSGEGENQEIVRLLVAHKSVQLNQLGKNKRTPLYVAAKAGNCNIVKILCQQDDVEYQTALKVAEAQRAEHPEVYRYLLELRLRVKHIDVYKYWSHLLQVSDTKITLCCFPLCIVSFSESGS